jgi:Flp pilus assembly pilin Flp
MSQPEASKPVELGEEETKQVVGGSPTAIEYGLIASTIGIAIISGLTQTGQALTNTFNKIQGTLTPPK